MKNKSKITKGIAIGLFVVAFLLNVSLTLDSGNSQNADLSLGSLQISLFQQAYACGGGSMCVCAEWPSALCNCPYWLQDDARILIW